jgi:hypothetical protein
MAGQRRLIPPSTGVASTTVNGRTYFTAPGAQDVPEFDAEALEANGWMAVAYSGTTAQRPTSTLGTQAQGHTPLAPGVKFFDSTLGFLLTWDGKLWRDETGTSR